MDGSATPTPDDDSVIVAAQTHSGSRDRPIWLLPAVVLTAWLALMAFVIPYDPDEVIYKIVVTDVVDGHWPYEHLFINRQPLMYLVYLPAGLGGSIELQRIVAAVAIVASVPPFYVLAKRWLAARQMRFAVPGYCVLLANPYMITGANVEAFLLFPLIAAIVVPSALVAGILIGAALMLKLTVLPIVPAILFMRRTDLRLTVAAAIATCVLLAAPFVPVWDDFWTANVGFNFSYGRYSAADRLVNTLPFHWGVLLGALPVWAGAVIGAARERRLALWLLLVCSFAAAKSTGFNYGHYYALVVPAAAIFAAVGVSYLLERRRIAVAILLPSTLIAATVLIAGLSLFAFGNHRPYDDLVAEIDKHPGELYVLGGHSEIYGYADRQPERRYFFSVPLVFNEEWGEEGRADLLACPPDVLVIPEASEFEVEWRPEIARVYGTRMEFENASLLTDPERTCAE